MRELQLRRGYQEVVDADPRRQEALAAVRATGTSTTRTCSGSSRRATTFALKPMNCPESTFIYRSKVRSYRDLPLRLNEYGRLHRNERSGTLSRPDARPPVHPGRRPRLRPAGPAGRRDRGDAGRGPRGVLVGRPHAALRVRDEARQGDRRPGAVGAGRGAPQGSPRPGRRRLQGEAEGRHVLRPEDRHLHRRRARARVADGDDPGRPRRCCPSGST